MKSLQHALDEYLALRRGLGFKLTEAGWRLRRFVAFADARGATFITRQLALEWRCYRTPRDEVREHVV